MNDEEIRKYDLTSEQVDDMMWQGYVNCLKSAFDPKAYSRYGENSSGISDGFMGATMVAALPIFVPGLVAGLAGKLYGQVYDKIIGQAESEAKPADNIIELRPELYKQKAI